MTQVNFDVEIDNDVKLIASKHGITKFHYDVKGDDFAGTNYTSKIVHVQIIEDDNQKRQINLLFKLALNNSKEGRETLPSEQLFKTEQFAYEVIFREITKLEEENLVPEKNRFKYATFYKGEQDFLKEYMVMEDLATDGFKLYEKNEPLDFEHCAAVLCALANYHAGSFAMKAKDPVSFSKLKDNVATQSNLPDFVYGMIKDLSGKVVPYLKNENQRKAIENFVEKRRKFVERPLNSSLTEPYNVLCHGDLGKHNMMFRKKDNKIDVMLLDYQLVRYASPVTDIIYNFYISTEKAFRDKHMSELCELYYRTLEENLKKYGCDITEIYPRNVFDKQMSDSIMFGVPFSLMASCLLLGKAGEEKDMNALINNMSDIKFTSTEAMIKHLEDIADDIIKYNNSQCSKNK